MEGFSDLLTSGCRCIISNIESLMTCYSVSILRLSIAKHISPEHREYTEVYRNADDSYGANVSENPSLIEVLGEIDTRYILQFHMVRNLAGDPTEL